MIHPLFIDATSTPDGVRKEARKKAMTGGVVIRISPDLSAEELARIVETFLSVAEGNNLAVDVLRQAAKHPALSLASRSALEHCPIAAIQRDLAAPN